VLIFIRTDTLATFQQLQQQKAELDLKIAQSMDAAKRMSAELEQARVRHEEVEAGTRQIMALMDKYNLSKEDLFPGPSSSKRENSPVRESKTLAEMRQYFNRR
jgi:antitoxin component HigA of HigAB toxin-antitoxin module